MRKRICGIYKITNKINGKIYIGQSIDIYKRWEEHKNCYVRKSNYLYLAFRKYGVENFSFEIIEECAPDELDEKEIYYISTYHTFIGDEERNGYNMSMGGEGNNGYGKPIDQYDLNGNFIKTYNSCAEFEREMGHSASSVLRCCAGSRNMAYGFLWRYHGDIAPNPYVNKKCLMVDQYDIDGNFIKTYDSITSASNFYKVEKTQISNCCSGKALTCAGYQWRKRGDSPPEKRASSRQELRKAVCQYDLNGKFIRQYKSCQEAAEETGHKIYMIYSSCREHGRDGNFQWRYSGDDAPNQYSYKNGVVEINQYDLNGNFIKRHKSFADAAKEIGKTSSNIHRCCNHKCNKAYGYIWRYATESIR